MGSLLGGIVLPLLLLTAALLNWSLISLVDLVAFLLIRFTAPKRGFRIRGRIPLLWSIIIYAAVVILSQVIFLILWAFEGGKWSVADASWVKLLGLMKVESWRSPFVIYFLVVQLLVAFAALAEIYENKLGLVSLQDLCGRHFSSVVEQLGSHLRVASCLLLPPIQLAAGISNPSWVSLPFFICSCVGLVDWSLTSNFLGLFRWWRPLWVYAGFDICLLYVYQLPVEFPAMFQTIAEFIGLYKISPKSEWQDICSSLSLIVFYFMLSCIKCDLEEMDFIMSMSEGNLNEQLLPSKHSFFIRESRSGVRHTNVLLRGAIFRIFSINFFTCPCWLFHFGVFILQVFVHLDYLHMWASFYMPFPPCSVYTG